MVSDVDKREVQEGEEEKDQVSEIIDILTKQGAPQVDELGSAAFLPHKFWDTQPVPKLSTNLSEPIVGPIEGGKTVESVRTEPYQLPASFEWVTCDVSSDEELQEIYTLLNENYVEDEDSLFRFDYSADFLRWALTPSGFNRDWHVGIRAVSSKKLVAFITGIPARVSVMKESAMKMAEINFLCVHKKLRSKRLAPVLI